MKKRLMLAVIGLALASYAAASNYKCQYDNCSLYFSGETKVESGKLVKLYKCGCNSNHRYWIVE